MSAPSRNSGTRSKVILIPLQIVLFALVAAAMAGPFVQMHRRQHRSWQAIVVRMSPECRLLWSATDPDQLTLAQASWARSPRKAFRDAGVLMEIVEFAERNAKTSDRAQLQTLRLAALQLRLSAGTAIVRRALFR